MKKKKQKNFWCASRWGGVGRGKRAAAVLAGLLVVAPLPALAYDNGACWHYAAQQGPRPDITCTKITPSVLDSLRNAPLAAVTSMMDEPGVPYPDGTLHYTGNDLLSDGGYQGTIALTLAGGRVVGIDARLDNPSQGGSYFYYRWTPASFCSDLPDGGPACGPQPPY